MIDIQVSVRDLAPFPGFVATLRGLGYTHIPLGDFDRVYPFFAKPADGPSTHHVHLCVAGGEQEAKHLAFRDYLRRHPAVAADYADLKRDLAARHHGETLESREHYSLAKSGFVCTVLERAAAEGGVSVPGGG